MKKNDQQDERVKGREERKCGMNEWVNSLLRYLSFRLENCLETFSIPTPDHSFTAFSSLSLPLNLHLLTLPFNSISPLSCSDLPVQLLTGNTTLRWTKNLTLWNLWKGERRRGERIMDWTWWWFFIFSSMTAAAVATAPTSGMNSSFPSLLIFLLTTQYSFSSSCSSSSPLFLVWKAAMKERKKGVEAHDHVCPSLVKVPLSLLQNCISCLFLSYSSLLGFRTLKLWKLDRVSFISPSMILSYHPSLLSSFLWSTC